MNLKKSFLLGALLALVFSCKKTLAPVSATRDDRLTAVVGQLRGSMAAADFGALDTTRGYVTRDARDGRLFMRLGFEGTPLTHGFVLVQMDAAGRVLAGSIVELAGMDSVRTMLSGHILVRTLAGAARWSSDLWNGYILALHPELMRGVTLMGTDRTNSFMPKVQALPDAVVVGYEGGSDFSMDMGYIDYGALLGSGGGGSVAGGAFGLVGGAGGGASGGTTLQPEAEYDASLTIVKLQQVLNCFGNAHVSDAGAQYTLSLCADVPVNADPDASATLSPGVSAGHSFLIASKTSNGVTVTQCIGFYPVQTPPWYDMLDPQPSAIKDNGGHEINAMITRNLTAQQFLEMEYAANMYAQLDYNLTSFNCTDFAVDVWNSTGAASMSLSPLTISMPAPGGGGDLSITIQNSPQGLYSQLQSLRASGVQGITLDLSGNLKAPGSEGQCPN